MSGASVRSPIHAPALQCAAATEERARWHHKQCWLVLQVRFRVHMLKRYDEGVKVKGHGVGHR